MIKKHILSFCLFYSFFLPIYSQNLIQNPDCELPLVNGKIPFWTETQGNTWQAKVKVPSDVQDPAAQSGNFYFFAGGTRNAELTQTVDVSNYSCYTDFGKMSYNFTAYLRVYPQSPPDEGRVIVEFLNAANAVLYSFDSGIKNDPANWVRVSQTIKAPINTRKIRIRLISTRRNGEDNDGYYDNLSLIPAYNFTNLHFDTVRIQAASCGTNNAALHVSMLGGSGVYIYSLDGRNFLPDSIIKGINGGNMRLSVLDTNGCYLTKDIQVPSYPAPIISSITTRPSVCARNNGAIAINAEGGASKLMYSLDKFNYQIPNFYDNIKGRNYTVYVKDSLDCVVSKEAKVDDIPPPNIDSIIIHPATCFKNNGIIEIIASGKGGQILYSLNGGNYIAVPKFTDLERGLYTIAVKDTNNCLVAQKINVPNAAPIVVEMIQTTPSVCDQNTGILFIKAKGGMGKITYALNNDKFQTDNTFANLTRGEYRITVKDSVNCQLDTLAKVQSDCGIFVPNIFSPNEDGVNDFLSFYGDENSLDKVLTYKIFNRWGNLIYDNPNIMMNNAGQGWNGKVNGVVLQSDMYVYIIEIQLKDGRYVQKKGDVMLMR